MKLLSLALLVILCGCSGHAYHWDENNQYVDETGEICTDIIANGNHSFYVNTGFPHRPKTFTTMQAAKKYVEESVCR